MCQDHSSVKDVCSVHLCTNVLYNLIFVNDIREEGGYVTAEKRVFHNYIVQNNQVRQRL